MKPEGSERVILFYRSVFTECLFECLIMHIQFVNHVLSEVRFSAVELYQTHPNLKKLL